MVKIIRAVSSYLRSADKLLLICSLLCTATGILMVNSATIISGSHRQLIVQIAAALIGIVMMIVLSSINYQFWEQIARILFVLGIAMLVLTLIFATEVNGSKSWIRLFGVSIQPSEFVKIIFILTFAAHLSSVDENINRITNVLLLLLHIGAYVSLVALQGDMGSALVYLAIGLVMLFIAELNWKYFLSFGIAAVPLGFLMYKYVLSEYQIMRILVVFNPKIDPLNYGWQTMRSITAIGSGRLVGQGYADGLMTQRGLIPALETDSIFAVIGEELGFIGSIAVMALLTVLIIRILKVSTRSRDTTGTYICIGIFAMLAFQMLENIGMSLGLLPVIGITLPFFSAGGSSMLTAFAGIGLAMSVYHTQRYD